MFTKNELKELLDMHGLMGFAYGLVFDFYAIANDLKHDFDIKDSTEDLVENLFEYESEIEEELIELLDKTEPFDEQNFFEQTYTLITKYMRKKENVVISAEPEIW